MGKKILGGLVALVVIGSIIGSHHGSGSSSDSSASASSGTSSSSSSGGSAHIVMLHGATSDNSCVESDGEARIYVVITLRNTGDADGTVNPWATFDYSDGGSSTESYDTNWGHELTVPAHSERDATFYHTFNPQQHSMIRCAGYADLNDSAGTGYYLPTS